MELTAEDGEFRRRLAIFEEGFTAEAAAAVTDRDRWNPAWPLAGSTSREEPDVATTLEWLDRLEHAGRLGREVLADGGARYRLEPDARETLAEQLEASGDLADLHREHAAYYLSLAEAYGKALEVGEPDPKVLLQEFANVQAALGWILVTACEETSAQRREALEEQGQHVFALTAACQKAGRVKDMEGLAFIAMGLAGLHSEREEESPWLAAMREGDECWERGDMRGAEAAYLRGVDVEEDGLQVRAHQKLAGLCEELGRIQEAVEHARLATETARGADSGVLVAIALEPEARHRLHAGDINGAFAAATEGLTFAPDTDITLRPKLRLTRAECLLQSDDIPGARVEIEAARGLFEPVGEEHAMGGILFGQYRLWEVTAKLHARLQDRDAEVAARLKAVELARRLAGNCFVGGRGARKRLVTALEELAEALAAGGRSEEAEETLAESRAMEKSP